MAEERILNLKLLGTKESEATLQKLQRTVDVLRRRRLALNKQEKQGIITSKQASRQRLLLNTQLKAASANLNRLTREQLVANGAIKKSATITQSITKGFANMALRIGGATLAISLLTSGVKAAFNTIKDFQQANADLASVLGKTRSEITELTDDAKRLGSTTAFTATEVSKLQKEFAKLGFSTNEILLATEATLDLAAATGTDLARAAEVTGSTVRAFGLDASETQRVVDVMAKSFSSSALDMEKFATAMSNVAPVAKNAGLSIEETTAQLGILVDRGIDASTAGTGLRNIFLELSKQGLTFEEAMQKINTATDKNRVALDLFGKRGATVATILAENGDQAERLEEKLNDAGGAAKRMADEQLDTLEGSITKLSSAYEGFILSLEDGEGAIAQNIKALIDWTTSLFDSEKQSGATKALLAVLNVAWVGLTTTIKLALIPIKLTIQFLAGLAKFISDTLAPVIDDVLIPAFNKLDKVIVGTLNTIIEFVNTIIRSGFAGKLSAAFGIELDKIDRLQTESTKKFVIAQQEERDAKLAAFRFLQDQAKKEQEVEAQTVEVVVELSKKQLAALKKAEAERLKLIELNAKIRLKIERDTINAILAEQKRLFEETGINTDKALDRLLSDAENRSEIRLLEAQTLDEERLAQTQKENARFQTELNTLGDQQSAIELATLRHEQNKLAIEKTSNRVRLTQATDFFNKASGFINSLSTIFEANKQRELSAAGDNAVARERIEKKFANKQKKLRLTSALINAAGGITRAFVDYQYPASLAIAALVAFSTGAEIAAISSAKFEAGGIAKRGGVLKGKSHKNGGIPFTVGGRAGFEAQGGEPILTKGVGDNPRLRAAASALNVAGGGIAFDLGGMTPQRFQQGAIPSPVFTPSNIVGSEQNVFDMDLLAATIGEVVSDRINDIKVKNVVTETREGVQNVESVESEASFG